MGLFGIGGDESAPIKLSFKSAFSSSAAESALGKISGNLSDWSAGLDDLLGDSTTLALFDSYSFERNLLSPAAPFRFTAPGVDKDLRMSIRSGDTVQLIATDPDGDEIPIATGFIDETDTHISAGRVEYVLTGRDTLGQLVDNAAIDAQNKIINTKNVNISNILQTLILNTRIPQQFETQSVDNGSFLFQTSPGETKMNALQRYLELSNCLVWTLPNGQLKIGKPNFSPLPVSGILSVGSIGGSNQVLESAQNFISQTTNVLDCRVRRNFNRAIRQIVYQMQNLGQVDPSKYTLVNTDSDIQRVASSGVGRSVYNVFTYGQGAEAVNKLTHIPNMPGAATQVGQGYALREIARDNVQVLDVEMTVQGHFNSIGDVYDVDDVYYCNIPDEDISENLYCYAVTHELTLEHGMLTKLRLCKLGTIVANSPQVPGLGALP